MPRSDKKNMRIMMRNGHAVDRIDIPMSMIENVQVSGIELLDRGHASLKFKDVDELLSRVNELMKKAGFE